MESGSLRAFSRGVLVGVLQFMFPSIDGNISLEEEKIKRELQRSFFFLEPWFTVNENQIPVVLPPRISTVTLWSTFPETFTGNN
jgi:hypothetical protein